MPKGWSATANLFMSECSKTIRSEYLKTLQLVDILALIWIFSNIAPFYIHKPTKRNIFECFC